jgi:hypothetical protein
VRFNATETILDAKRRIGYKLFVARDRLKILYRGRMLNDNVEMTPFAQGRPLTVHVRDISPVLLLSEGSLKIHPDIEIRALMRSGTVVVMTVSPALTVWDLKEEIAQRVDLTPDLFDLIYQTELLMDVTTLSSSDLQNGSLLFIVSMVGLLNDRIEIGPWVEGIFAAIRADELEQVRAMGQGIHDLSLAIMFLRAGKSIERLQDMISELPTL